MKSPLPLLALTTAALLAACGGGGDAGDPFGSDGDGDEVIDDSAEDSSITENLPTNTSEFRTVCDDQIGFEGATAFDDSAPGPRLLAPLEASTADPVENFSASLVDLPPGWVVELDDDFEDNSEFAPVQLVSCLRLADPRPTGVICELEGDDGSISSLELVDGTYELNIYTATTAALLETVQIEATNSGCPRTAFVREGQTEIVSRPSAAEITVALKPLVSPNGATSDPNELPRMEGDFDRVCTSQVGFSGTTALSDGPGPHPIILFEDRGPGLLVETSFDMPEGWRVDGDSDFDDNSELQPLELVACSLITEQVDTAVDCQLEDDDGTITLLNLINATYEIDVYQSATGFLVGAAVIVTDATECPSFVFVDEDQTDFVARPDADEYIIALAQFVAPS